MNYLALMVSSADLSTSLARFRLESSRVGIPLLPKPTRIRQVWFGLPADPSRRQLSSETDLRTKIEKFIGYFNAIIKALPLAIAAKPVPGRANESSNNAHSCSAALAVTGPAQMRCSPSDTGMLAAATAQQRRQSEMKEKRYTLWRPASSRTQAHIYRDILFLCWRSDC
jgi:hypothetical protein